MGASGPGKILLFEGFRFDVHRRLLCRIEPDGSAPQLTIGSRALDILTALVERRGELVNKQELLDAVWPNTAVEENNLTVQISRVLKNRWQSWGLTGATN